MERRLAFAQGAAAALLLWTGFDGSLPAAVGRLVPLPAGAAGDFLAFLMVAAWGALALALAWHGITGRPLLARAETEEAAPRRRSAPARRRRSAASA